MAKNLAFVGIEELSQVLAGLAGDQKLSNKVVRGILNKAAKPIADDAKARVAKRDGDTAKSIGNIPGRGQGKGEQVYVGPRRGGRFKGYAGHLIEYGTAPRKQANGRNTGAMPALPFMRPAFDSKKGEAIQIIKDECKTIILNEFKTVYQ